MILQIYKYTLIINELLYISIDDGIFTAEYLAGTNGSQTIKYVDIM